MNLRKEDLLRINEGFGGGLRNDSSLDFAFSVQEEKKMGDFKKLAHLIRAILVDHPFTDGNKRTAMYVCLEFANENKKIIDNDLLIHQVVSIAKNNITNIRNIADRLKTAIK